MNPLAPVHRRRAALRTTMAAVRVSLRLAGRPEDAHAPSRRAEAAETFGAEARFSRAGKSCSTPSHPAFKAVTAVRNRVIAFWKSMSLPYPEPGIRLIRQDRIDEFDAQMREFREELAEAVETLDRHYSELKATARQRLGTLYNAGRLPGVAAGHVRRSTWDFPSVEPPDYLQQLNPELYEQECQRVQQRFDEAVRLAEEAFTAELAKLVSHLTERLSGSEDGKPKIFRDSAVENLTEFFERFRELNVRSNEQLDQLVADAQRVIRGVEPQDLRDNAGPAAARGHGAVAGAERAGRPAGRPAAAEHPPPAASDEARHATRHRTRRGCPVHLLRGDRPGRPGQPRHFPGLARRARPARTLVGRSCRPLHGPTLGPFPHRSEALAAEQAWLETNWLGRPVGQ